MPRPNHSRKQISLSCLLSGKMSTIDKSRPSDYGVMQCLYDCKHNQVVHGKGLNIAL